MLSIVSAKKQIIDALSSLTMLQTRLLQLVQTLPDEDVAPTPVINWSTTTTTAAPTAAPKHKKAAKNTQVPHVNARKSNRTCTPLEVSKHVRSTKTPSTIELVNELLSQGPQYVDHMANEILKAQRIVPNKPHPMLRAIHNVHTAIHRLRKEGHKITSTVVRKRRIYSMWLNGSCR